MRYLLFTILIYIGGICCAFCQTEQGEQKMSWEDFVAVMMEENEDESVDEETMEQLFELYGNPMDINTAKKEDLEMLPFLNEEQVEEVLRYREKDGPMMSLGELMMVKGLGMKEREMMRLFVKVEEDRSLYKRDKRNPTLEDILKWSKHEMVLRTDVPFYKKDGYQDVAAEVLKKSPNKVYRGDRFHHAFRYAFSGMNHLLAGVQMEKDAGEKGIDHVSGYVMLKNVGIVKSAILGNYRVSFGKGLTVNSGIKFGKSMMMNTMDRMDMGITKHSSTSETGYFTGGAFTIQLKNWQLSVFGSYRKEDGTYNNDSTGMSSLKTDGLHRTKLEHSKKGNLGVTNFGGNIHWEHKELRLSATAVWTHLDVPLMPKHDTKASKYRIYNASGKDFFVGSLAYAYRYKSLSFSGETAFSNTERQHGVASLNTLRWRANRTNSFMLIGRYYGAKFISMNGRSFGENSSVQNEEGIFVGWTSKSIRNMELEAYADMMYFPWLKQGVSASSHGLEGMVQALYSANRKWSLLARYRIKSKQKDMTSMEKKILDYDTHQSLKLQLNYTLSPFVTLRTSAIGSCISNNYNPTETGLAICENFRWQNNKKIRFDLGITYFNTNSYDARVYIYEPSLLYSFGSTSFYDEGIRGTLLASLPIVKQSLFINAKLGMTKYFNRDTIGSGLEMIHADHREDLQVQIRYKF